MDAGEFSRRDSFSIIYQEIFLLIFISNYSLSLFLSFSLLFSLSFKKRNKRNQTKMGHNTPQLKASAV